MKAARAAEALMTSGATGITVSTLKEGSYFLEHGFKDITYAVGMVPTKLPEVTSLMASGADLKIMTDNLEVARAIATEANQSDTSHLLSGLGYILFVAYGPFSTLHLLR